MKTKVLDLIDFKKVDSLLEGYSKTTGFVTAILDLEGNVLSKSGWRSICSNYHRVNHETAKNCRISDTLLANKMAVGERYHFYKCLNGLVDVAVPLMINNKHVANIFSGQFFFEKPDIAIFRKQAETFGFDSAEYLEALAQVPVVSKERVELAMDFLQNMAQLISELTLQKLEQSELNRELEQKEDRLSKIMLAANDGMWDWDLTTNSVYFDPRYYQMAGYEADEFPHLLDEFQKRVHPDDVLYVMGEAERHLKGEVDRFEVNFRFLMKSGNWLWIQGKGVIVERDELGAPRRFVGTHRDISELKASENALAESEERFRTTLYSIGDGVITTDTDGRIKMMNPVAEQLTGWTQQEATGKALEEVFVIFNEDSRKKVEVPVRRVLREGVVVGLANHTVMVAKDGRERPIADSGAPIRNKNGEIIGVVLVFRDQTEEREADRSLRETEEKLSSYIRNAPDGIFISDENGNYVEVNPAACKLIGYHEDELVKLSIADIIHPEDTEIGLQHFHRVKEKGFAKGEVRFKTKHGQIRYWNISAVKLSETRYLAFVQDITERKLAEAEIWQSHALNKTIIESIPGTFYMIDKNGLFIGWNAHQRDEIVGQPESLIGGMYAINTIHPDDRSIVSTKIEDVIQHGAEVFVEARVLIKGGPDFRWMLLTGRQIWINDSPVLIGTGIDITGRKESEVELYELKNRYQGLFENSLIGIGLATPDGEIIESNEAFAQMLGYSVAELKKLRIAGFYVNTNDRSNILKILEEKKQILNFETKLKRKDGRIIDVLLNISIIRIKGKTLLQTSCQDITERKQAEEKIMEQGSLIRIAAEKAKLGGWNVLLSENRSFWSDQVAAIHEMPSGYAPLLEEGINFYAPEWRDRITQAFSDCAKKGIPYDEELEIITATGKRVWVRTIGEAVRDENGKIFKVQGGFQDISEKKLIEARSREKDLQFRKLSANVPDLIYQFTRKPDGTYCVPVASEGIRNIFGCNPEDVIDDFSPIAKVLYPDDAARVIDDIEYSAKHLTYFTCEFRVKIPGKEIQWIFSRSNPEKLPDGSITWYGFNVDITERKKSEEALHQREALLSKIFDVLPVGLWLADKEGKLIRSNASGREIWGAEPLVDRSRYGVFKARRMPEGNEIAPHEWALTQTIEIGATITDEMLEITTFDGKKKVILNYTAPILDKTGNVDGAIIVNLDITERNDAEEALRRQNGALSALNRFSIELSMLQSEQNIEAWITKKIKEISGAEVATFSEYNAAERTTSLLHIEMEQGKIGKLVSLIGTRLKNIKSPITEESYHELIGERIGLRASLHEASFGAIPRPIGTAVEKMLGVDRFIGLAYLLDGRLYGTTLLAMGKDTPDPPREILENFVNMAALSIKRKKAEEALLESEDRFKKLSSFTFEGIIIHNNAVAIDVNQTTVELLGFKRDEIIGMNLFSIIHPDSHALVKSNIPKPVATPYQIVMMRKDGSFFDAEIEGRNIHYNGESFRVACIRDITVRKKAEEALSESEAKFREMAELLPQIVFETDLHGNLTYVNKQAYKISGYPEEESLIGKSTLDFYIPEDRERAVENIKLSLGNQKKSPSNEYTMMRKDGSTFNVLVYSNPILKNKKPVGLRGIIVDITEIKKTEQELIRAKAKAEEADQLKSAFLANMSHEIRTPMNGILGFADLLENPNLTGEEQQSYIEIIKKSGARMLNIINDIINISKIEAGLMKVNWQHSNVNEQIEYIFTFFKPEVEGKGLTLSFSTALPLKEAIVYTDREKLYAILTNLVKNAIKYTENGSIDFGYIKKGDFLEFYVTDTGIGIPKDRQQAIFERFIQADISDRNAYQGAGLGLSISKAYVEMLGGHIRVESEPGKGSCFCFTIPVTNHGNPGTTKSEPGNKQPKQFSEKLKLLIAEDDDTSFLFLKAVTKTYNFEIVRTVTGRQTVEYCESNTDIDVILMDIKMPDIDGYKATRRIREFNKEVIIIAQTANAISGDREKAIEAGCNDYIAKPINKDELMALFQKYLE